MKFENIPEEVLLPGPAPQGAGGLKSFPTCGLSDVWLSRPARGGWIEIMIHSPHCPAISVPPRKGRVD